MSGAHTKPARLPLIIFAGLVVVADAALYKQVFEKFGTALGATFMIAGSIFVIACLYFMERRG